MNTRLRLYLVCGWVALLATILAPAAWAQEEKPFADQKFVLQISDMDPDKQTLVLNVAGNIIKAYGQDRADVEIVAFGPGLRLLFAENSNAGRIAGLTESGVRFAACNNTLTNMTKTLGTEPKLNPNAKVVPGGIVRIKELADQGYLLVKP
jgi:intracellular sulfur oxidation DsrE/DsrF family protein